MHLIAFIIYRLQRFVSCKEKMKPLYEDSQSDGETNENDEDYNGSV